MSYYWTLVMFNSVSDTLSSNWNEPGFDEMTRECGALTDSEIDVAKTDLHEAVLNRIKVRLFMEGEKAFMPDDQD
jgi:hypothetical protein